MTNADFWTGFPTGTVELVDAVSVGDLVDFKFQTLPGVDCVIVEPILYERFMKQHKRAEGKAHRRRMIRRQGGKH